MIFYSGFSFSDEAALFKAYLQHDDYTVAGFSYGAIKAALYAADSKQRVDRLQLLSPAFFQNKTEKFKRMQMMGYAKDKAAYLKQFRKRCFSPYPAMEALPIAETSADELEELLGFVWEPALLEAISEKGTKIEVYLGGEDAIIDAATAMEFFKDHATVYLNKKANHFLMEK